MKIYDTNGNLLTSTVATGDLNDLDDVDAGAPTDDYVLTWDSDTSKWVPQIPTGEMRLTPKASSSGPEGTVFYDSDDDHVYCGTE